MADFKIGDAVQIVDRNPIAADTKSGLFYAYYRGLTGAIFKVYGVGPAAQAAVEIDLESLPEEIGKRHLEARDRMARTAFGEARRGAAAAAQEEFRLRYVLLVAVSDLTRRPRAKSERAVKLPANGRRQASA